MLKKILTFLSISVYMVAQAATLIAPVSALEAGDVVIQIRPAEIEMELAPGQTYAGTFKVENVGRLGFTFNLSTRPYQVVNESYDPDFYTENNYTKIQNWITFKQNEYHIESGESMEVPFQVTVPEDAPGGGQYAAIIVETRDSSDPEATVRTISQLALKIYAHVEGEEHVGGVLMGHSLPGFVLGSPLFSTATVKNDGNVDFRVNHQLTVYDFFTGNEVFTPGAIDLDGQMVGQATPLVLPETVRTNMLRWEGSPQLGVFRAVQTISFLDQEYSFEQIVILCPLWLAGIVLFFVVVMVLWIITGIRHRRRRRRQSGVV